MISERVREWMKLRKTPNRGISLDAMFDEMDWEERFWVTFFCLLEEQSRCRCFREPQNAENVRSAARAEATLSSRAGRNLSTHSAYHFLKDRSPGVST